MKGIERVSKRPKPQPPETHTDLHILLLVDTLDRLAGVPDDKIVEAHGSFARQSCIECKNPYPEADIKEHIAARTIPRCYDCKGLVKPEIVFFGEQLPAGFFEARSLPAEADLCIVMGTSLTVQPFASLPSMCRDATPRILINKERVGGLGTSADDVLILGDCDEGVRKLAEACGWLHELEALWAQTVPEQSAVKKAADADELWMKQKRTDEELEDEIARLTREVDETLNLSKWHEDKIRNERLPTEPKKLHEDSKGGLEHVFVGQKSDDEKDGSKL